MSVTVADLRESIAVVRDARQRVLARHDTASIITALDRAAASWLAPDSPWRARAIAQAPGPTGFSPAMIAQAVDLIFEAITADALQELLVRELGDPAVLDGFQASGRIQTRATGPRLIAHFLAGNIPAPGIQSICLGLLLRAGNVVRPSTHDPVFPALFVESLRAVDADLAACVAVAHWPKDNQPVTQAALYESDAIVAFGHDSTIATLRKLAPAAARFLGYGHKMSFAVITREALSTELVKQLAEAAAFDASVYDQQGCLSPHLIFVEERGAVRPRQFAAALAEAMAAYHARIPSGPVSVEVAARLTALRTGYEFRAESDKRVAVWAGQNPNDWCVIYDDEPTFAPSALNRMVLVKPTDGLPRVLAAIERFAPLISTVGVAATGERQLEFATEFAKRGINRVCAIGDMQRPLLAWYHDGRPNIADLLRWTDVG